MSEGHRPPALDVRPLFDGAGTVVGLDLGEAHEGRGDESRLLTPPGGFVLRFAFDPGVPYGFDEDMWERRLRAKGGRIVYLARAGLVHRRDRRDARLWPLLRESYRRGRALRRYVEHRGDAPSLAWELRVLGGCVFHIFRYRCGNGILLTAHSAGRLRQRIGKR